MESTFILLITKLFSTLIYIIIHQAASVDDDDDEMCVSTKSSISTVVSGSMDKEKETRSKTATLLPSGGSLKVHFKLSLLHACYL